jgi:hypothetical protein
VQTLREKSVWEEALDRIRSSTLRQSANMKLSIADIVSPEVQTTSGQPVLPGP